VSRRSGGSRARSNEAWLQIDGFHNDSPITVGADPQGWGDPRFFFTGRVQQVMVQGWEGH
jgi:hypothetical protein